eukprot:TRINITY_DN3473_c0_g1_i1.p1 TRINITY_DN3473_c0_g1~~TRINITY_DN3473_c0_g1_i1.p1  ORF type:complete len:357 (-),score=44.07 TRINITY_DN3473_c0_g1_i1:615-1628(-)
MVGLFNTAVGSDARVLSSDIVCQGSSIGHAKRVELPYSIHRDNLFYCETSGVKHFTSDGDACNSPRGIFVNPALFVDVDVPHLDLLPAPGLDLPSRIAGMPAKVEPSPGLDDVFSHIIAPSRPSNAVPVALPHHIGNSYHVKLSGLPKELLTDLMMRAVLEQAGLEDALLGFTFLPWQSCGEVVVTLSSLAACKMYVRHFSGCHWHPSGKAVTATILPSCGKAKKASETTKCVNFTKSKMVPTTSKCPVEGAEGRSWQSKSHALESLSALPESQTRLSAKAATFVPGTLPLANSADRPHYHWTFIEREAEMDCDRTTERWGGAKAESDASTDIGDLP